MRTLLVLLISMLLIAGCGKKTDDDSAAALGQPTRTDDELLMSAATRLLAAFRKELKTELMAALNEGGPENAVSVCQVRAPQIADAHSSEFWTIKRVTDRNRNIDNLADQHELSIMARFTDTTDSAPEFIFEWSDTDDGKMFRYYKPIVTAPLCMKCHGAPDDISLAVKEILAKAYPQDRAVGYKPGELRGMFVVEAKWPEGKPFAESIVADSL